MDKIFLAILGLILGLTVWPSYSYCQVPVSHITVGQKNITLQAPMGFIDQRRAYSKADSDAINFALSQGEKRRLTTLVSDEDFSRIQIRRLPKLGRVLNVDVLKRHRILIFLKRSSSNKKKRCMPQQVLLLA